ncbi:ferritin-like domain-containing protein [Fictibacillus enclensis]|jgi:rubrerythrin|uniref:Rubrerythrin family protein n=1 Tax=Fictibacillus enclensis TaxID=1017270 RepID=A0A0V8J250_9BACL|nr:MULTISPECIES: ferritin-like domain-containing protein [Fictibacillus]KSU81003.1 rubrerythrin family protein [Fictibacillus enclensis]MDM5336560.1 ferritin-like domain-containing protein [Fictibacillus enclensis]RXZ00535.1 ferritin-like domain-containing protein [Fictibacillus sp. S7]WHY73011.1 ferritin-like domain-containing protein [Fictibacillus enclensis]SCC33929.1 Rubrerythrin [Fictibacillus enclensis]
MYNWNRDAQEIANLEKALNGEYSAIICYEKTSLLAPNPEGKKTIQEIRQDEVNHYQVISAIYTQLTGRTFTPKQTEACPTNYREGLKTGFKDEQETVDFYLKISDQASNNYIKEVFKRIAMDEQNHAVWFLYLLTGGQ